MKWRRAVALASSGFLVVFLLLRSDWASLHRQAAFLFRSASLELTLRRLNGSSAAFDRQFFLFLESVHRQLPAGTKGVAIYGVAPSNRAIYLATYWLTPVPVRVAPSGVPPGWVLAVYGSWRPPGARLITPLWNGVLLAAPG